MHGFNTSCGKNNTEDIVIFGFYLNFAMGLSVL